MSVNKPKEEKEMAEKKVPYYTINSKNKTIIVNDAVKKTEADELDIYRYLSVGYTLRHKSAVRTKNANSLTKEQILEALKDNKEAIEKFNSILNDKSKDKNGKHNGSFFKAKSWYIKEFVKKENK